MKIKKTLLLLVALLACLIGLPAGIYGLTLSGGAALGGLLILMMVFAIIVVLVLEQLIVNLLKTAFYTTLFIDLALLTVWVLWCFQKLA